MSNTVRDRGGNRGPVDPSEGEDGEVVLVKNVFKAATSDYWAHARKDCAFFPFNTTPSKTNVRYCNQCYCYMCDAPAMDCKEWGETGAFNLSHCHAWSSETWREKRSLQRKRRKSVETAEAALQGGPSTGGPQSSTQHQQQSSMQHQYQHQQQDQHQTSMQHQNLHQHQHPQWGSNYYGWPMSAGYHAAYYPPYGVHCYPGFPQQAQYAPDYHPLPPHLRQETPWRGGTEQPEQPGSPPPPPHQQEAPVDRSPLRGGSLETRQATRRRADVDGGRREEAGGSRRKQQRTRSRGRSPRRPSDGDGYFEIENLDGRFVQCVREKLRTLGVEEQDDPSKNARLAHWGTVALKCKVLGDQEIEERLLRFGIKGKTREADIRDFCEKNELVSLWNLNKHLAFKDLMDPRRGGETVLLGGVARLLQELIRHSSVPEGGESPEPQMYTALRWLPGISDVEGTLEIKVYLWKIGERLCLLNQSCSTRSMDRLLLYFCSHGESDAEKAGAHIHKRIHQWQATIQGEEQELPEESIKTALEAMSYNINDPYYNTCTPPNRIKVRLPPYQVHGIIKMMEAENQELGFADELWVRLKLGSKEFWYSPFLKRITALCPRRQCSGGFLAEQSSIGMMLMTLGLVVGDSTPPRAACSKELKPSKATLVVCPQHQIEQWIKAGQQVHQPFKMVQYETLEAPDVVYRCDVVVVRYATLCKEYIAVDCEGGTLFSTSWHRIVFSCGEILFRDLPIVAACEKVKGHVRWILVETPVSSKLKELWPKFRALNLDPWFCSEEFDHLTKFAWMPLYLMSRLVIRHGNVT
ncbi:hypothetical protein BSKO_03271 [Bryopsis sp. KO-2023]|nr:hypothetical protein BSKO_03271 [Bryopsis sp. KO-2023]